MARLAQEAEGTVRTVWGTLPLGTAAVSGRSWPQARNDSLRREGEQPALRSAIPGQGGGMGMGGAAMETALQGVTDTEGAGMGTALPGEQEGRTTGMPGTETTGAPAGGCKGAAGAPSTRLGGVNRPEWICDYSCCSIMAV